MANEFRVKPGSIFDPEMRVARELLACEMCGKNFLFSITPDLLISAMEYKIVCDKGIIRPKNCSACEEKIRKALQERAPMNPVNGLGGLMGGLLGAIGGAVATQTVQSFQNPYAQQQQGKLVQNSNELLDQQQRMAAIKALQEQIQLAQGRVTTKPEVSKSVKETPKIELNPKRAVQLED